MIHPDRPQLYAVCNRGGGADFAPPAKKLGLAYARLDYFIHLFGGCRKSFQKQRNLFQSALLYTWKDANVCTLVVTNIVF